MQDLKIDSNNLHAIEWDEDDYKYCDITGISPEGGHVTADFTDCTFRDVDWYWGMFNIVNFIGCRFINCTFRGTAFSGCRFVECDFAHCRFVEDNLNGACSFDDSVACHCSFQDTKGFAAKII